MKDTKRRVVALVCAAALMLNLPAWAMASENAAGLPEQELIAAEAEPEAASTEAPEERVAPAENDGEGGGDNGGDNGGGNGGGDNGGGNTGGGNTGGDNGGGDNGGGNTGGDNGGDNGGGNTGGDNGGGNTGGDNGGDTSGDNTGGDNGGGNTGGDNGGGNTGGENGGDTSGDNTGGDNGGDTSGDNTGGDNGGGDTSGDNTGGDTGGGDTSGDNTGGDNGGNTGGDNGGDTSGGDEDEDGINTVEKLNQAIKDAADGATIKVETPELVGDEAEFIDIRYKKKLTLDLGTTKLNYKATAGYLYALRITGGSGITVKGGNLVGGGVYVRDSAQNVTLQDISVINAREHGVYVCRGAKNTNLRNMTIRSAKKDGIYVTDVTIGSIKGCKILSAKEDGLYFTGATLASIEGCTIDGGVRGIELKSSKCTGRIAGNTIRKITGTSSMENAMGSAILLSYKSSVQGSVSGNKISSVKGSGILVTNGAQSSTNSGSWVTGDISGNTIANVKGDGIGIYHGAHCNNISNNTISTVGGNHNGGHGDYGIIIDSSMKVNTYASSIKNNTISNVTYAGIAVYSGPAAKADDMSFQDTAFVSGDISGNKLTNMGTYQPSKNWAREIASGGKKGCLSGIYVDTHACVKGNITGNSVDTTGEHGIYIHLVSWVNNISGNTVQNAKQDGIEVYTATVKGSISGNTITNSGEHGISALNKGLIQGKVEKNTVTGAGMCGIYLDKSQVKGVLNKNKLTKVKKHGINISGGSFAAKANGNTIAVLDAANSYGIRVTGKSKLPGITGNKVSGKMKNGIRIDQLLAKTTISKNTLSVSGKKSFLPMNLTGAPKLALIVTNNTITGNLTHYGITLSKGIATIKGNTIKKCTYPINVVSDKFAVTVQGNKVSQNKNNMVRAAGKKVDAAKLKKPQKVGKVSISA